MKFRLLLGVLCLAATLPAAPAHADTMLYAINIPDPSGRCYRRIEVWYDTTRVPPVWSRGYVVCS